MFSKSSVAIFESTTKMVKKMGNGMYFSKKKISKSFSNHDNSSKSYRNDVILCTLSGGMLINYFG